MEFTMQQLQDKFAELYGTEGEPKAYFAPGRVNLIGEHTDYNGGHVFPCALTIGTYGLIRPRKDRTVRFYSMNFDTMGVVTTSLDDLVPNDEAGWTNYPKGVMWTFEKRGFQLPAGADILIYGDIPAGSGLSSSAAFEVLIGTIIDQHDNEGKAGAVEIAKIGQYAENRYFGKKSGLMDQMVSSVGSFVFIDFEDTDHPKIEKLSCQFEDAGYVLCITDTKGSHADLTDDYVSIPAEMNLVAAQFGKNHLREVSEQDFLAALPTLRTSCSDRAIIRAAHFYGDNRRASEEAAALSENDFARFLELVKESGDSSAKWLQNLYSCRKPSEQGITLGLWMSEQILGGKGASRVHGGGFAGTIQAFVPKEMEEQYCAKMDALFGSGSCQKLRIRTVGGVQVIA